MALKFSIIIKSFFPKGKIWEFQKNFDNLIDGISKEFSRIYNSATAFYNSFNIIQSELLAGQHSRDHLIIEGLYTNRELQRIITLYLNKDFRFREVIEDFANFIGVNILWSLPQPLEFGVFQFGDEFGDATSSEIANLFLTIGVDEDISCRDWNKLNWLVNYLKPPYISIEISDSPINSITPFTFGLSQFGDDFGELDQCHILK